MNVSCKGGKEYEIKWNNWVIWIFCCVIYI